MHIRRDGARYDASCAIFDWILREIFSNPLPAKLLLCPTFGATCVYTEYTRVRKRVDGLFVSRELENAFQRIPRDGSVLETGLFVEKRELLCYGFYTLSAPISFPTELCASFSLDVGILMTERGLILFSFRSIRFVDYFEINYKLNY